MRKDKESSVIINKFTVGQMGENCYVLMDTNTYESIVIDPGDEASYLAEKIQALQAKPVAILATHGHFDHVLAACELQMIYQVPFRMHVEDQFLLDRMSETAQHFLGHTIVETPPKITKVLKDGEKISIGKQIMTVIATPGHTPGSVCFYLSGENSLFAGDTIFASGGVGRTDFSYSDKKKLYESIERIMTLGDGTILYPGHGEESTIFKEKQYHVGGF